MKSKLEFLEAHICKGNLFFMIYNDGVEFNVLKGKVLSKIEVFEDEIYFNTNEGKTYKMHHQQNCCESVIIEDICGIPIQDLLGDPILLAEERISENADIPKDKFDESYTWTFYELATIKGNVTIRWYGTSNGYYSESVSFEEIKM